MGQTFAERAHRLQDGRCPVHGTRMRRHRIQEWRCPEGRLWYEDHEDCACRPGAALWQRVDCPRGDCGVTAREWALALHGGPYDLVTSWEALPDGWPEGGGPVALEDSRGRREDDR